MTIIEWMAAIIAVGLIVKLVVVMISPKAWLKTVTPLYSNSVVLMIVGLILSGGSLYYLLDAGMSIVDLFAALFFLGSLALVTIAGYSKELLSLGKKLIQKGLMKRMWLAIIIWIALSIWAIKELFF